MKKYSVIYAVTTSYEAVVKAENVQKAKERVKEVIGDPVKIERAWELSDETN